MKYNEMIIFEHGITTEIEPMDKDTQLRTVMAPCGETVFFEHTDGEVIAWNPAPVPEHFIRWMNLWIEKH